MNTYKYIDGYENYIIFRTGKIYSVKSGKFMKPSNFSTYKSVGLSKDGKETRFRIHRLLGLTFIPNPDNKKCIDHINRNPNDNRIENLRWVTHRENSQNRTDNNEDIYIAKKINKKCNQGFYWEFRLHIDGKCKIIKSSVDKEKLIKFKDEWLKNNNI